MISPWDFARRYAEKSTRLIVGLMSGTSVDGVDAALVRLSGSGSETRAEVLAFVLLPFPADLAAKVLNLCHGHGSPEDVSRAGVALAESYAEAVNVVLAQAGIPAAQVDAIACHGQTVSHTPHGSSRATLQIGDPSALAFRTGLPVVSNFRAADVAAGGQGAPLVPYADWCLLTHPERSRAVQNLGGIGNVTYLPANAAPERVLGFDTGPGNVLIDFAARWATDGAAAYDAGGLIAARGSVLPELLESLLKHPYLAAAPPKSCGREEFGRAFFDALVAEWGPRLTTASRPDLVATLTAFTASTIADAYARFLPEMPAEVVVGGGGTRNATLMQMLSEKLSPVPVKNHEFLGINSDIKEAMAFAVLANETLLGRPANLPSVTGASRPVLLGSLTLPP